MLAINIHSTFHQLRSYLIEGDRRYSFQTPLLNVRSALLVHYLSAVYSVFNGDLGWVVALDMEGWRLTVDFDGVEVGYGFNELDELLPAYAISVHRSQGSEYPAVVVPVMTQHYPLLQRNLLYTTVTRARRWRCWSGVRRP